MVCINHLHLPCWLLYLVMTAFFFLKSFAFDFPTFHQQDPEIMNLTEYLTNNLCKSFTCSINFPKKIGAVIGLSVGLLMFFIISLSLRFWRNNRFHEDEYQSVLNRAEKDEVPAAISELAEEEDDKVHLDESMEVDFYECLNHDGVDLDESVDDVVVDFSKSMDDDFTKASGARKFSYDDLASATNNFSEENKLGEGGFGAVHKGFLKELKCHVALKRVSRESKQGIKEYAAEVKIIGQQRHRNIVQLIGWCHERKELLLVYEYMANGSLDYYLFKDNRLLTWEMRYKIVQGLASGLFYLHEGQEQYAVHRDIKPSNILLDASFNAKLGDFGLARLVDHGKYLDNTTLAGTIGYVAPEYATSGKASKESDVYSFGSVVLEIACGRKVVDRRAREDQINLREWVWYLYGEGKLLEAVDPRLNEEFGKQQVECLMIVGLWCAHPAAKLRPTIEKAIHVLNSVAPLPHLPSKMPMVTYFPSFSMPSGGTDLVGSQKQSPSIGHGDLVPKEGEELATRGFGALYEGFLKELNSYVVVRSSGFRLWKRSKGNKDSGLRMFSYKDLVCATNNFSEHMRVGYAVYKGFLEEFNSYVAVKEVSKGSKQVMRRYATEINTTNRLRHRNLVHLIGFCQEKSTLFLIYEFMPNGCLDWHLFKEDSSLTWEVRYKIARDLASVLLYLHEECGQVMVHGDIKSSSVLLDSDFHAKLGDFSRARLMDHVKELEAIMLSPTIACFPPECVYTGKATKKSDVYNFGIVLLEIACGGKPINLEASKDQAYIVKWVWDMYGKRKLVEATDPKLNGNFDEKQMECLMVAGLWCAFPDAEFRPSIREVVKVMNFEAPLPLLPSKMPGPTYFFAPTASFSLSSSSSDLR